LERGQHHILIAVPDGNRALDAFEIVRLASRVTSEPATSAVTEP